MEAQLELAMIKNLSPLKKLFQSAGLWAFNLQHKNICWRIINNIHGFINVSLYALVILGECIYMICSLPNLDDFTSAMATSLSGYLSLLKLIVLFVKRKSLMYTVETLAVIEFAQHIPLARRVMEMEVDDEALGIYNQNINSFIKLRKYLRKSLNRTLKECRYIFILNSFFVIVTLIGFGSLPGIKFLYYGKRQSPEGHMYLPFRSYAPFDQTSSPGYEILYSMQVWASFLTISGYSGIDTFVSWHFILIRRQFELIIHVINNLEEYSRACVEQDKLDKNLGYEKQITISLNRYIMEVEYDEHMEKIVHNILTQCVDHYSRLMGIIDRLNGIFSGVIFVQMISTSMLLCVVFFKYKTDSNGQIAYLTYTCGVVCQLFLYCWYGQTIINVTSDISDHIYDIRWYKFSPKFQKTIVMLQRQYQRPITITALGFTTLSLPTLTSILSTAMSYLALLNFLLEKKT